MISLQERKFFLAASVAVESLLFVIGISVRYYALLAFAAIGTAVILVAYFGWDIIDAIMIKHTGVIELLSNYRISGEMNSAVFRKDKHYSALCVARVENLGDGKFDQSRFDKMVAGLGFPFRISIQLERMNTRQISERLQTKKRMKEIRIADIGTATNKEELEKRRLMQEVAYLQNQISEINGGGTALRFSYNLLCVGNGDTAHAAEAETLSRIRRLCSEFDSAFGSSSKQLRREELTSFIMMELLA